MNKNQIKNKGCCKSLMIPKMDEENVKVRRKLFKPVLSVLTSLYVLLLLVRFAALRNDTSSIKDLY